MFKCGKCHEEFEEGAKALRNVWICPECFEAYRQSGIRGLMEER